jgi:hypothetical protein
MALDAQGSILLAFLACVLQECPIIGSKDPKKSTLTRSEVVTRDLGEIASRVRFEEISRVRNSLPYHRM